MALVVVIHGALGLALVYGLAPNVLPHPEIITRLVQIALPSPPPPPPPPPTLQPAVKPSAAAAAPAPKAPQGGTPRPVHRPAPPPPIVLTRPTAAAGGGVAGNGTGTSAGDGAGGGTGGDGDGSGDGGGGGGGTGAELIRGEIIYSDYPRDLAEAEIGGRVYFRLEVSDRGQVQSCKVIRSSGSIRLDELTCQLIRQRFRYRPATDERGRPSEDELEGSQNWVPRR